MFDDIVREYVRESEFGIFGPRRHNGVIGNIKETWWIVEESQLYMNHKRFGQTKVTKMYIGVTMSVVDR